MTPMTGDGLDPSGATQEPPSSAAASLRRALRFWGTAAVVFAVGCIACGAFLLVRLPSFRSETVILYSEGVRLGEDSDRSGAARSAMARLKEILMSRTTLDTAVREFHLYPDIRTALGPTDAVEELRKHVEFRAPGGDTFSVAFTGSSPSEARAVTARLAEVVLSQDADLRKKQAVSLREFLENERRATEDKLRDAELALASFMAAHPRFALDATPLATGAAIRASFGAATAASASPAGARPPPTFPRPRPAAPQGAAAAPKPTAETTTVEARETAAEVARATAALAAARVNLTDLAARFTPAHPDVRAAQAEVERATSRLAAATAVAASLEDAALAAFGDPAGASSPPPPSHSLAPAAPGAPRPVAGAGPRPIAATRSGAPPALDEDVVALETEWVKLTRGATEARQHEDQVEAAQFKARSSADSEPAEQAVQASVIDPAFLPQSPVPPGRAVIVALFAGCSLLLAALGAFIRSRVDDRVYERRDVLTIVPLLASVPRRAHVSRH